MQTSLLDARIDTIYRLLRGRIDWANLAPSLVEAAYALEQISDIRGSERLDILQRALKHALKEADMPAEEKERLLFVIDTIVPLMVQSAILASKTPIVSKALQAGCFCWKK